MKAFADKIREARCALGLSQEALGRLTGVSKRSIAAYESGEKLPRDKTLHQLARALHTSIRYLRDEDCDDPAADLECDPFITAAAARFGTAGARDVERMLTENMALFAGGSLSQEEKDVYFRALCRVYEESRELARKRFGRG